jgi:choline kinase
MKISSNIIILGAKPIKGMRSVGAISNVPICGKRSILDLQIQNLKKKFTCDDIIYVGGYTGDSILEFNHKHPISYINNPKYDTKNNAHSLRLTLPHLYKHDCTLILFSKILFNYHIFDKLNRQRTSTIFIDNSTKNLYKIGCNINADSGTINNLFYGLDDRLCGIYFLRGKEHELLLKMLNDQHNIDNFFIFEIINAIIESGGSFYPSLVEHKLVNQIDSNNALKKTVKYYAKNFSS